MGWTLARPWALWTLLLLVPTQAFQCNSTAPQASYHNISKFLTWSDPLYDEQPGSWSLRFSGGVFAGDARKECAG